MSPLSGLLISLSLLSTFSVETMPSRTIDLAGVPFTNVLDFESPKSDRLYVYGRASFQQSASFTGKYGLSIPAGQRLRLRVGAAMIGREFPGRWKYLGFHTRSASPAHLRVLWHDAGRVHEVLLKDVNSVTRQWIKLIKPVDAEKLELELINESGSGTSIGVDDFILCDPERVVQTYRPDSIGLERRGLSWYIQTNHGRFEVGRWDPLSGAIKPTEWSPLRLVFVDTSGRQFSIDSSNVRRPTVEPEALLNLELLDDSARIDRNSPGDSDKDGYDQVLGSYHLHALTPTVSLRVSPQNGAVSRALFEVGNLPTGEVRITVAGELVSRTHRFSDGRLLFELPITIDRPMQIEIRSIQID